MADLSKRAKEKDAELLGPYEVTMPTDRRNPDGSLVMIETENPDEMAPANQKVLKIPEMEAEPFFKDVYFRKVRITPKRQKLFKEAAEKYKDDNFGWFVWQLLEVLVKWDLTEDGKPVEVNFDSIMNSGIEDDMILMLLRKYNEVTRIPLVSNAG